MMLVFYGLPVKHVAIEGTEAVSHTPQCTHNLCHLCHLAQGVTTLAWAVLCLLLVLQSSRHLEPAHVQLLWTFFQPAGPMLLMLVLYAQATQYFEHHHIQHEECYSEADRRLLASSSDLYGLARVLVCFAATCLASSTSLCASRGSTATAAAILIPPLMYGAAAVLMLMPVNVLRRPSRSFFCKTLGRVLVPAQQVSWADFLLADILTSLAKSSSDLSRSTCLILHGEQEGCGVLVAQEGIMCV
jgi:hypothetical protein